MYKDYFGLKELPFSIAPDPRYLYMSERHREALAHLLYGVNGQGGFVVLTGEVGTGKTTICRCFLNQIPKNTNVAFVVNPKLTALELMETICDEFAIEYPENPSIRVLTNLINHYLLASHGEGEHTVLIIDEAQNLEIDVLEQLRLLTNLETSEKKLLQIVLLGQPELREILARNDLRQLAQRITARYHLTSLSRLEVGAYLKCRLSVAGQKKRLFSQDAVKKLYQYSHGIPRLINLLADRSLLGAYAEHAEIVDSHHVIHANRELKGESEQRGQEKYKVYFAALAVLLVFVFGALIWNSTRVTKSLAQVTPAPSDVSPEVSGNVQKTERVKILPVQATGIATVASEKNQAAVKRGQVSGVIKEIPAINGQITEEAGDVQDNSRTPSTSEHQSAPRIHSPFVQSISRMNPTKHDKFYAFKSVLATWGVNYAEEPFKLACEQAEEAGLSCLHKQGNWRRLIQLNRPAVLKLINEYGQELNIALLRLDGDFARIQLGKRIFWTYRSMIDALWYGNYSILWRLPPYKSRLITPGAIIDENKWLSTKLDNIRTLWAGNQSMRGSGIRRSGISRAETAAPATSVQDFDLPGRPVSLKSKISWFQRQVGLFPDGIAGSLTLIQINNFTDADHPVLLAQKQEAR